MKVNDVITKEELEALGWERKTSFGNCWIYQKDNVAILWNPIKQLVVTILNLS
jgi:hypothetical protein